MQQNHFEQINDESHFFQSFKRSSFFASLAAWSRFFCYGFLLFNLASIILQLLIPYAVLPPDLFLQFLFILLIWGSIELIAIPLEAIQDTYTLDYQKNWVIKAQHRFFFKRVVMLASFNQIKAIGVSCRPRSLSKILFAKTDKRYAIQILDLNNKLISLSNFNLSLEEANGYVQTLYTRYLSGAQVIVGMPDCEIIYDPINSFLQSQPCKRSLLSIVDALCLPVFHALFALTGTGVMLFATLTLLGTAASSIFNTNLQIASQPGSQLLHLITREQPAVAKLPPPSSPPPAIGETANEDFWLKMIRDNEVALQSAAIELFKHAVADDKAAAATLTADLPPATADTPPEITVVSTQKSEPEIVAPPVEIKTIESEPPPIKTASLPVIDHNDKQPEVVAKPIKIVVTEKLPVTVALPKKPVKPIPVVTMPVIEPLDTSPLIGAKQSTAEPILNTVVIPGTGIDKYLAIGQKIDSAIARLGTPLAAALQVKGRQIVFRDFTIKSRADKPDLISSITLTRSSSMSLGKIQTPEKLAVGSKIAEVTARFGPATLLNDMPGLHFPQQGISFLPASRSPLTVGAILIYAKGSNPADN